jgi:tRNA-specific 2-thiouridylase
MWIDGQGPDLTQAQEVELKAKIRYRQDDQTCRLISKGNNLLEVVFEQPQRAVTPGQSIVFYDGDVCLGGAVID